MRSPHGVNAPSPRTTARKRSRTRSSIDTRPPRTIAKTVIDKAYCRILSFKAIFKSTAPFRRLSCFLPARPSSRTPFHRSGDQINSQATCRWCRSRLLLQKSPEVRLKTPCRLDLEPCVDGVPFPRRPQFSRATLRICGLERHAANGLGAGRGNQTNPQVGIALTTCVRVPDTYLDRGIAVAIGWAVPRQAPRNFNHRGVAANP